MVFVSLFKRAPCFPHSHAALLISDRGALKQFGIGARQCVIYYLPISVVYTVTKDNKFVTKHRARC